MHKSVRNFLLISFCVLAMSLSASAAEPKGKAPEVKAKAPGSDMIDVEADRLDVYKDKGEAVFTGNVKATQGNVLIKGTTLTLYIDNATNKVDTLVAEKNVYLRWEDKESTCDKAVYTISKKLLQLSGDAVITRGQEKVSGQKIVIDMLTNRQTVESGQGGRVKLRVKSGSETGVFEWKK